MIDDVTLPPDPTPDEFLGELARALADDPPERIPSAANLPDDVRDGRIEDPGEDDPNAQEEPIAIDKEP